MMIKLLIVIALLLTGCSKEEADKISPLVMTKDHACQICGMILFEYPGPKAQILYREGSIETFCCTPHMFMAYLAPERPRHVRAIYVHDMGKANWDHPKNEWIDAKTAFYVFGGDKKGPMGEPLAPFSVLTEAEAYVRNHKGRIVRFDEINVDMLNTKINRINFNAVEKFIANCWDKEVIAPTLKKFLVTLGSIFKYAVQKGYCEYNPVREIEKPKLNRRKPIDILKPKEIRALLDHVSNQKTKCLYTLAVMSGMRQGEILGLKWTDIDWFNCQVHVKRTFNHGQFHEPKTEASRRAIDLGPTVISELKIWKIPCPPNELNLVFPNEAGKPIDANNLIKRDFDPTLRRAGIRGIHFHCLRHTYASLLIDRGEHPKYI